MIQREENLGTCLEERGLLSLCQIDTKWWFNTVVCRCMAVGSATGTFLLQRSTSLLALGGSCFATEPYMALPVETLHLLAGMKPALYVPGSALQ